MMSEQPRPYSGLRILDLSQALGAYATRLFADLGADVVRVRSADDPLQGSPGFHFFNSRKTVVSIGDDENEQARLAELARECQVVVYEADERRSWLLPLLTSSLDSGVITAISHFGLNGPYAQFAGCDLVDQAVGGIAWLTGEAGKPPLRLGGEQSAIVASIYAAAATAAALWDVETRGGRHIIDVSVQEAIAHSLQNTIQMYDLAGVVAERGGKGRDAMEGVFRCEDGYVFLAAPPFMGDQWNQILAWMAETNFADRAQLIGPEWDSRESRAGADCRHRFREVFEVFLGDKRRAGIAQEAMSRKILIAPVSTVADLPTDPQLMFRSFFHAMPDIGRSILSPGAPYYLSEPVWGPQGAAAGGAEWARQFTQDGRLS